METFEILITFVALFTQMSFKEFLDHNSIDASIRRFSEHVTVIGPVNAGNSKRYTVTKTGSNVKAHINLFSNTDASTTLGSASGNDTELFNSVCEHIIKECKYDELPPNRNLYIKKLPRESFDFILDFLAEEGCTLNEQKINHGVQFKVTGPAGDTIHLNHFKNGSFQVQGKGLLVKSLVVESICAFIPDEEAISIQLEQIESDTSVSDVIKECQQILPSSFDFLGSKIIAILSSSIAYRHMNLKLQDYSSTVFPAFRTLEGYLKRLFGLKGIQIGSDGFGDYFDKGGGQFVLAEDTKMLIANSKICEAMERSYKFYVKNRHGFFHIDKNIETSKTIETKEKADDMIEEILNIIEESYLKIIS